MVSSCHDNNMSTSLNDILISLGFTSEDISSLRCPQSIVAYGLR